MNYLTEQGLKDFIENIYPNETLIFNKKYADKFLPDIYIPSKKLVIEFDGYFHYSKSSTVINDKLKDNICNKNGDKIIRIPYFVQLSTEMIEHFFDIKMEYEQTYQHGFIDEKALLPADFCELGVEKFYNDLLSLPKNISEEIIYYLTVKIKESKFGTYSVIPKSMKNSLELIDKFGNIIVNL